MPLTVKLEDGKVIIDGTLDDPVMVARIKQIQQENDLETFEEAMGLCLRIGAQHMRFTEMPIQDGQRRGRPADWKLP